MTKLQILALFIASIALIFFTSCDSEDYQETDVYKVTPELRSRINRGMRLASRSERKLFNEKFDLFISQCDQMAHISSPHVYMDTEEYQDFRSFVLAASPNIYYLVMNKFLKGNPGFFSYIIYDLLIHSKPVLADEIAERIKAVGTLEESFYLYPQLCLDIWVDALENQ